MPSRRRRAAVANRARLLPTVVQALAHGGLLSLMLLNPSVGRADPARPNSQLVIAQSGVRLRLGQFVLGPDWVVMTVLVENKREAPVELAALVGPENSNTPEAVLSDERGGTCDAAEHPQGVAEIPQAADESGAAIASMTDLPVQSALKVVFNFPDCRLSHRSRLSLSARFAMSTNGRDIERFRAKFWGIVQRTIMR
jgi:hypothetical protein